MKCPACGSDVVLELGFIVKCEMVEREGKFYGQLDVEVEPDFVGWICDSCGEGGEITDNSEIDIFADAKLKMVVEWSPTIRAKNHQEIGG